VGLVLYGANENTLYEIDSNGRLRGQAIAEEMEEAVEESSQSREEELELLDEISQIDTFAEEKLSFKDRIARSFRWLTELF